MGNPEPNSNREDTQVDNLCYERRDADWHRLTTCATSSATQT